MNMQFFNVFFFLLYYLLSQINWGKRLISSNEYFAHVLYQSQWSIGRIFFSEKDPNGLNIPKNAYFKVFFSYFHTKNGLFYICADLHAPKYAKIISIQPSPNTRLFLYT